MVRSYNLVSADSHVNPLPTFWRDYLPRKFREVAPLLEHTDEGDFLVFEGKRRPFTIIGSLAGKDPKDFKVTGRVSETRQGGWDPIHRILDLDIDGVDAEILYGGGPLTTRDPDLFAASFPAYNSWLGDFCNFESGRLLGIGYIPMMDQEAAVEEVKRIAKNGLRGIVIPPFPRIYINLSVQKRGNAEITIRSTNERLASRFRWCERTSDDFCARRPEHAY